MSTPTQKHRRSMRNQRRSHHSLSTTVVATCPKCQQPARPHTACPSCGTYKGKVAMPVEKRTTRRIKRKKKIS